MRKILIFICLVLIVFMSCKHNQIENKTEANFVVTKPVKKDTIIYKEYVCQIRSIQHIEVRAIEKGYLQHIYVDEGQLIKKGQLMFQIMPLIYDAEMRKAQAEVNFADIEFNTTKNLADSNIVSKNELAFAKAKLDKAKAELSLAKAHLGFTTIRAPFNGIMDRFNVRIGSLLDEGELLTSLSDNSKMWVYFNVPEAEYLDYIMHVKSDKPLRVTLQMANKQLFEQAGIVETIEADFNNETGNIAFRAAFPNIKGILKHGETGNILMPVYLKNALLIPQKSAFEILDKKYVYVVDANGIIQSRQISTGVEMPHIYTVVDGLKEGDNILVEGLRKVKNKQHITYDFCDQQKIWNELSALHAE